MKKITFLLSLILILALPGLSISARELPFTGLSQADMDALEKGEPLFRMVDSYKDMRLEAVDDASRRLLRMVKKGDPNFLSEIIMVVPVEEGMDYISLIRDTLMDVMQFDTISYYSVRNEKEFPLFEDSEILSRSTPSGGKSRVLAAHTMKPFHRHETLYEYEVDGNTFFFTSTNTTPIRYKNFRAVKEGNMINVLWVQDQGDRLVAYGAGGASVFSFFGLFGDRMDDSFTGRVEAFFSWFYDSHISEMIKR